MSLTNCRSILIFASCVVGTRNILNTLYYCNTLISGVDGRKNRPLKTVKSEHVLLQRSTEYRVHSMGARWNAGSSTEREAVVGGVCGVAFFLQGA